MAMKPTPANAWIEFTSYQNIEHLPEKFVIPFCGLCGNKGVIDTRGVVKTPQGADCGIEAYCICPNGRKMKTVWTNYKKWGGDSVITREGLEKP